MRPWLAAALVTGASFACAAGCDAILGIDAFPDLDASAPADGTTGVDAAGEGAPSDQGAGDGTLPDGAGDAGDGGVLADAGDARADAPDAATGCVRGAAVCAPSCFETSDAGFDAQAPADGLTTCGGPVRESCCTSLAIDGG